MATFPLSVTIISDGQYGNNLHFFRPVPTNALGRRLNCWLKSRLPITNRGKRASDHFRVTDNLSGTLVIISQNAVFGPATGDLSGTYRLPQRS